MTPVRFEAEYAPLWLELEAALDRIERGPVPTAFGKAAPATGPAGVDAARMTALYRRCCEQLSLAQERAYPIVLTQRLQTLTQRAHQLIYRRRDYGSGRLKRLALVDLPQCVRLHRRYLLAAILLFLVPALLAGWAAYRDPSFALRLIDARELESFRQMYSNGPDEIGRHRGAPGDWAGFGFYIMHNISLGFQCFAGGIFAGLGSVFFLVFNGLFSGVLAGYLTQYGYASNFYPFVITHSAFELTAICLSGAAGLRIGRALIAPGRRTRVESLRRAAAEAVVLVYGVFALLVVAAALEAFWSAAPWIAASVKYAAGACAWALVIAYLSWQGRPGPPSVPVGAKAGDAG